MDLKVAIADDDESISLILSKLIENVPGFKLIGTANDGEKAVSLVRAFKPDVVFLDVEMPVLNGLECAKKIADIVPRAFVIFVTAHEEYMPEAFLVYAFDYMVKPFKNERVYDTLKRISELHQRPRELIFDNAVRKEKGLEKLLIKNKEGISLVDISDIILIERCNNATVVHTAGEQYTTSDGLNEIYSKLNGSMFLRSHKSYIINIAYVHKISPYGRWTYLVELKNTEKDALLTHEKYEELEKRLGYN